MRFQLDGLDVFFPYDYLYKEQYEYMLELKRALDAKGHAILEMPTGTGKTVCLLSLITSYQYAHPETGKLIYCTRTVPEMTKCMEEVQRVIDYRVSCLGPEGGKVLSLCLSSRRNMCIHGRVSEEGDRDSVDSLCRGMTASWVRKQHDTASGRAPGSSGGGGSGGTEGSSSTARSHVPVPTSSSATATASALPELCSFYEAYDAARTAGDLAVPSGIFNLDEIKLYGRKLGMCPYFVTRHLIHHANILVYNYQYMLDPKVAGLISSQLASDSIVVFDEAHNIDNVCIEALSVTIDKRGLEASTRSLQRLQSKVAELKATDNSRLQAEYASLVNGLIQQGVIQQADAEAPGDSILASPLLPADVLEEAVPGSIRKAEHFVVYLKKIIEYLKHKMRTAGSVTKDTPLSFLLNFAEITGLEDRKPLRFTYSRLNSLLRTLEITSLEDFLPLQDVANFATLVSTYLEGFAVIMEPEGSVVAGINEPLLQLCCLDASLALKPVVDRFPTVVITSGTLSPMDMYPKLLGFDPVVRNSLPMSTFRPCLLPLIVSRGSDQTVISTKFDKRDDSNVIRNYGLLLLHLASVVPDGICGFFTSYQFMESVITQWDAMGLVAQIMERKLIYIETKDVVETTLALDNYKRACDCGRGAIFLSVARGKVAEGVDFDRHYGRCVVLMGIPYRYTQSHSLLSRLQYMRSQYHIHENDFLTFDAMRQAAQCVGRVIRSKTDYGVVILADKRFNRNDKRSKFPPWITSFLRERTGTDLSTDVAVEQVKTFLRSMGQPIDSASLHSILMTEEDVAARNTPVV